MRENFEAQPSSFEDESDMREDLHDVEERISRLREEGKSDRNGLSYRESMEVSNEWLDLLEYGAKTLGLDEKEEKDLDDLMSRLLRGELKDQEMEKVIEYMVRFQEAREKKD